MEGRTFQGDEMSEEMRERWKELSEQLDVAFELTDAQRGPWLEALRSKDPELATIVDEALKLRASENFDDFLQGDSPVTANTLPEAALIGRQIGPYVIDAEVGHGGMGSVWRAHRADGRYEALVAIKFVHAHWLGKAGEERFQFEGRLLARLNHPNIARLLDAGLAEVSQPYLVLEFVDGQAIDQFCEQQRLDVKARIRLFIDVLRAVAHAHSHLIVHRDIKPSNVYVRPDGTVKLLDFGIAKLIDAENGDPTPLTRANAAPLTPQYASPEQLLGQPVSTVTDVYALGLLLYVLLTGEHPVPEGTRSGAALIQAVLTDQPPRASAVGKLDLIPPRLLQGDLDNIVNKAIKKDPAERYASADAFAEDLQRYLADQPVLARPDSALYRVSKFIKRHRAGTSLAATALIALTATGIVAIVQGHRAELAAVQAQAAKERADHEAADAKHQRDVATDHELQLQDTSQLAQFVLSDTLPRDQPEFVRKILFKAAQEVRSATEKSKSQRATLLNWLSDQFESRRDYDSALALYSEAAELALGAEDKDWSTIAASLCRVGYIDSYMNRVQEGVAKIDQALAGLPKDPYFARARIDCDVAKSVALGNGGQSGLEAAEAAEKELPQLDPPDPVNGERVLMLLTGGYTRAMRVADATAAYAREEALLSAAGREDDRDASTHYNNQGHFMWRTGRPLHARDDLNKALALEKQRGNTAVSPPLQLLGARVARSLGNLSDSVARYTETKKAAAQLHDALPEAQASAELLSTLIEAGEFTRAEALSPQAEKAQHAAFPSTHWQFGYLKMQQALLAEHEGHGAQAQALADSALTPFSDASPTYFFPLVLVQHSDFELRHGHIEAALSDAQHALSIYEHTFGTDILSAVIGDALTADGRALAAKGETATAREKFSQAALHYADSLGAEDMRTLKAKASADK
jgi:eukaryotic-like serine/threonine-protein kinase